MIVVGMTNGVLNVKHRKPEDKKSHEPARRKDPSYRMFVKGKDYIPKQDDFIVSKPVRQHLRKYDKLLRGFQVSAALDAALEARSPEVIVAVMN
ncbi:U3 small nucleolar RNA-associated protein 15 homolog [Dendrobates tinctorius]|uniref:U3 small nucleolar RNA-associated protein 15 homolog n=1 Tax=Dendrobates tinctorius TaxID=92724 RepID=UPI003CC98E95